MNFKASATFAYLNTVFSAECRAYTKYMLYSRKAGRDGFPQISAIFREIAQNELNHAKTVYMLLNSLDTLPYTSRNLQQAAACEKYESEIMYKKLAVTAADEGFANVSAIAQKLADTEHSHMNIFEKLAENMDSAKLFCKDEKQKWICRLCGYEIYDWCSPQKCPLCSARQDYFQIKAENY